jgi:hypothetical protein
MPLLICFCLATNFFLTKYLSPDKIFHMGNDSMLLPHVSPIPSGCMRANAAVNVHRRIFPAVLTSV